MEECSLPYGAVILCYRVLKVPTFSFVIHIIVNLLMRLRWQPEAVPLKLQIYKLIIPPSFVSGEMLTQKSVHINLDVSGI